MSKLKAKDPALTNKKLKKQFEKRFIKGMPDECWSWCGKPNNSGYGRYGQKIASRIAYELYVGKISSGMQVNHSCDNRICVNPHHLHIGTNQSNANEMVLRNRVSRHGKGYSNPGSNNGKSKLIESQIMKIRTDSRISREIAKDYGVCASQIRRIKNLKAWRECHVSVKM